MVLPRRSHACDYESLVLLGRFRVLSSNPRVLEEVLFLLQQMMFSSFCEIQ